MKTLLALTVALVGTVALADGHGARPVHGGHGYRGNSYSGGHHGGHRGGAVVVRPNVYVAPRPHVYVAPRPVYVGPRHVRPARVWVAPSVTFYPRLPVGVVSVSVGPRAYWYGGGYFYAPYSNGYQVVSPPIGAALAVLPEGAYQEQYGDQTYASFNGTWFVWDGYRAAWVVTSAPY